jgi:hypothetical protein
MEKNDNNPIENSSSSSIIIEEKKESKKKQIFSKITKILFKGWKKDLKKLQKIAAVVFYLVIILGIISYFSNGLFGWKTKIFIDKVNYKEYSHIGPDFSFEYPDYFQIDDGEGKKYGNNYLTGMKLVSDSRTGCDVRLNAVGLNFQKSDEEITKALAGEISKSAQDFQLISSKRFKIDNENAFSLEFSFKDPINSRVHLNQVLTIHENNFYMIICGTGEYQYKFFEKDFQSFLNSIEWKK